MSEKNTFVYLCAHGELLIDEIDDFVDEWHDSNSNSELYEHLGMTRQEYKLWVHDPDMLNYIINARASGRSIDDVLSDLHQHDLRMAARADSPEKADLLMKWLKSSGALD